MGATLLMDKSDAHAYLGTSLWGFPRVRTQAQDKSGVVTALTGHVLSIISKVSHAPHHRPKNWKG